MLSEASLLRISSLISSEEEHLQDWLGSLGMDWAHRSALKRQCNPGANVRGCASVCSRGAGRRGGRARRKLSEVWLPKGTVSLKKSLVSEVNMAPQLNPAVKKLVVFNEWVSGSMYNEHKHTNKRTPQYTVFFSLLAGLLCVQQ